MRRTLVTLATAVALTIPSVGVAVAQDNPASADSQTSADLQNSSDSQTSSDAPGSSENGAGSSSIDELPEELRLGSSGLQQMSSAESPEEWFQGSSNVALDWIIGAVIVTVVGQIIQLIASNIR